MAKEVAGTWQSSFLKGLYNRGCDSLIRKRASTDTNNDTLTLDAWLHLNENSD